jgi:two-component system nitrogen regulation response regulator NtrX
MSKIKYRIMAVDDEPNILLSIKTCLPASIYQVDTFTNITEAYAALKKNVYDCALIDIRLGNDSGIQLYNNMKLEGIDVPSIFISGNASLNEAVESQKLGAYDFIEKPFSSAKLIVTVENCINFNRLMGKLGNITHYTEDYELIGEHPQMNKLKMQIIKVAQTDAMVFIQGESGTGKELIARSLHKLSTRAEGNFVTVNCSAIPENLIESALFGHVKGAFTGAVSAKKGYFEQAHKGTIFLDEIGDMPLSSQSSLLRVLENNEIQKVGAESCTNVDVRVIAASHKNLKEEVQQGRFREDLFYRISVIPIHSPALRERISDLGILAEHIAKKLCRRHGMPTKTIHSSCFKALSKYRWPGNIRELTNTLERMLIMGAEMLTSEDVPTDIAKDDSHISGELSLKAHRDNMERHIILERLKTYSGNISQVARSLEVDRTNLHKKIKYLKIDKDIEFR